MAGRSPLSEGAARNDGKPLRSSHLIDGERSSAPLAGSRFYWGVVAVDVRRQHARGILDAVGASKPPHAPVARPPPRAPGAPAPSTREEARRHARAGTTTPHRPTPISSPSGAVRSRSLPAPPRPRLLVSRRALLPGVA
ncbi:hypothetical protein PHLGIDRAFT_120354 [Phlebiopsis gigantea 11061_1 CR5-6]|uniref:Uncharacterized protein n=1 Tax=Phlebiopsis gigantea (strain 11061_1 CR5-6) TaxID=745531 RepID=A0A0C3S454_PHLG1|nr:hypothetical protein PHLGIDRAFT_120354 [Phlebiopsis gigantea 11061_1 CR5-6]